MGKGVELSSLPFSLNILRLSDVQFDRHCLHVGRFADARRPEVLCHLDRVKNGVSVSSADFSVWVCACVRVCTLSAYLRGCANVRFCTPS